MYARRGDERLHAHGGLHPGHAVPPGRDVQEELQRQDGHPLDQAPCADRRPAHRARAHHEGGAVDVLESASLPGRVAVRQRGRERELRRSSHLEGRAQRGAAGRERHRRAERGGHERRARRRHGRLLHRAEHAVRDRLVRAGLFPPQRPYRTVPHQGHREDRLGREDRVRHLRAPRPLSQLQCRGLHAPERRPGGRDGPRLRGGDRHRELRRADVLRQHDHSLPRLRHARHGVLDRRAADVRRRLRQRRELEVLRRRRQPDERRRAGGGDDGGDHQRHDGVHGPQRRDAGLEAHPGRCGADRLPVGQEKLRREPLLELRHVRHGMDAAAERLHVPWHAQRPQHADSRKGSGEVAAAHGRLVLRARGERRRLEVLPELVFV